jgi:hypothetical protein
MMKQIQKMFDTLPDCMVGAVDHLAVLHDDDPEGCLINICETQLELIAEGQDGTEDDNPKAIKKWLKRWKK